MVLDDRRLLLRFRQSGDVDALSELFDRAAPALLRLALHLARDAEAAEDLVQATFLRAIEVREQWDASRPPLPWLCGILQNRARHARWHARRVPDATRLRQPTDEDPVRAAEGEEFDAAVDAAIAGVSEVYRPVLRLHLVYGHTPVEIAHALERPAGTVRSQLARGLEMLRRALPVGFAALVGSTLTAGRGLAAVKAVVLGRAAEAQVLGTVAWFAGGTLMKKSVAVVSLLVVFAACLVVWSATSSQPQAGTGHVSAPLASGGDAANGIAEASVASPERQRVETRQPVPSETGSVRVACRWDDDGSRAAGVWITATPLGGSDALLRQSRWRTAHDGVVSLSGLRPGRLQVASGRGGECVVDVVAGATTDAVLRIPDGIDVHGIVVDDTRVPVANAAVWLSEGAHDYTDGAFVATSDANGRFVLRSVQPERFVGAVAAGRRAAAVQPLRGDVDGGAHVELVLAGEAVSLHGVVFGEHGARVADARVLVGERDNRFRWTPELHGARRPSIDVRTDERGEFTVHGLEPGASCPVWVRSAGTCCWYRRLTLGAHGATRVEVHLTRGATLEGRATDAGGHPTGGAFVGYRSSASSANGWDFDEDRGPDWANIGAVTDDDGRYRIAGVTPGNLWLRARTRTLEVRGQVQASEGELVQWHPVLVEIALRGRVVDQRGRPIAGVDVTGLAPRGKGNMATAVTGDDGRFVCRTLAPVPYVLSFHAPGDSLRARPAARLFGVEPGREELLVTLADDALATAWIWGVVLDRDGRAPAAAEVRCSAEGLRSTPTVQVDAETGRFEIGPLPPGEYRLQASVDEGEGTRRSPWSDVQLALSGRSTDFGVLQMPATGSILVTVDGPDGEPLHGAHVVLEDSSGWLETPRRVGRLDRGRLEIPEVAPGEHRIRIDGGRERPDVYRAVTVAAGQRAALHVAVPAGVEVDLVLSPITEPAPMHEWFEWRRDGELVVRYQNWWEGNGVRTWPRRLLPGEHEVVVTSETGRQERTAFVVRAGDARRRVWIRMP